MPHGWHVAWQVCLALAVVGSPGAECPAEEDEATLLSLRAMSTTTTWAVPRPSVPVPVPRRRTPPPRPPRPTSSTTSTTTTVIVPTDVVAKGILGEVTTFQASSKAMCLNKLRDVLRAKGWLQDSENCEVCPRGPSAPCCVVIEQGGVVTDLPVFTPEKNKITLNFSLKKERGMEKELVQFVRDLPVDGAEHNTLLDQFQKKGIFQKKQLAGINPSSIKAGSEADTETKKLVRAKLAAAKSDEEENLGKLKDGEAVRAKREAEVAAVREQVDSARQKLADATKAIAQAGNEQLSAQTKQNLEEALNFLNTVTLAPSDLSLDDASSNIDARTASGGFVTGRQLGTLEMLDAYGLLRGVLVTDRPLEDGMPVDRLALVCDLRPTLAKSEEQLKSAISLIPDLEETEYFVEAQDAKDVQAANAIISSYGTSAMSALSSSWGLGLSVSKGSPSGASGGVTGGIGVASSSSYGDARKDRQSVTEILQTTTKELTKTRYFFAPKMAIAIDPLMLQSSAEFQLSWYKVAYMLCKLNNGSDEKCAVYEVPPDNLYGVDPGDAQPNTSENVPTIISFIVTNYKASPISIDPAAADFKTAIRTAIGLGFSMDLEEIEVKTSTPSGLLVEDRFNHTSVVVTVPAKTENCTEPSSMSRYEFFQRWQSLGYMQSKILQQLAIPVSLQSPSVSVGEHAILRLLVAKPQPKLLLSDMSASGSQPIPQPTSTPTTPTAPIPTQEEVNAEVRELIYKFGSHVCMDAVLGGYWRIDAKYQSTTTKDRVQVDNIVSKAITQAESDSWSFGISASVATADNASGAASGGAGSSSDNSGSTDNTNGNSQASGTESKDTKLTIEQSWKGGAAGTNPGDWRKSLAAAFSSNWRVIDHVLPKCVGIWEFVDDDATKTALCNGWLDLYLDGPTKSITSRINDTVREKACESTLNMNALRTQAQNLIRLETDARDRLERQRCAEDKVFSRFWIKADKVRNGGTAAELAGIRFGLNKETSLSTTAQMYSFYTGTPSIVAGFQNDAKQSITDFSYKLSAAGSSKDPIQFTIYGQEDAGPTVKLLTYQMDPDIQLLTNISDGQTNFYRQAYSEWIPVQGASKGFIWDETEEVCRPKRCFCTDKDGKVQPGNPGPICTSPDGSLDCDTCCPTADRQKCGESDLAAQCPSLGQNYKLLDPNTRFEPCRAGKCTIDVDGFKCCRDVTYAKSFNVEIRTPKGNDCGTDSTVQVRMNVATPDGTIYLGGWSHDLGIRKGPNFDQGMIDSFTLNIAGLAGLNVPVKPVYICFRLTGNDEWCIDWVKIYNADLPSEYQVGDQIKGWDERFQSTSVWCKYLTYT